MADRDKNPAAEGSTQTTPGADPATGEADQNGSGRREAEPQQVDYTVTDPETGESVILSPDETTEAAQTLADALYNLFEDTGGDGLQGVTIGDLQGAHLDDTKMQAAASQLQGGGAWQNAVKQAQEARKMGERIAKQLEPAGQAAKNISTAMQKMGFKHYDELRDAAEKMKLSLAQLQALLDEIDALEPYLREELAKPEYEGATITDLLQAVEMNGEIPPGSLIDKALTAAREKAEAEPGKATITRSKTIDFPLDKVNNRVWRLLEEGTDGQLKYEFNTAKRGSKDESLVYYAIDFENLGKNVQITKRLQPFDKRVYIAVAALFNAGNDIITLTQIFYHMGYTGRPNSTQLEKIRQSVVKMLGAQIVIDNSIEAEAYKYEKMEYRGALLPVETGSVYDINGTLTNAAIHLFREPPLVSFARNRGQITTVGLTLLQSPVNKTDSNILIDDYLIERISRAKNGKQPSSCRILLKTLYEHTGIDGKTKRDIKKRQRAPETIERYLTYYQQSGFIKGYVLNADSIDITL